MRKLRSMLFTAAVSVTMVAVTVFPALAIDKDIVILHTNDVHCGIEDNIGYAGVAAYKEQMKEETPYVTLVDAGDAIQGAPVGTLSEGEYIIRIMNEAGYDVAVPGNHEFDYGLERLLSLAPRLNCGYISCNLMNEEKGSTVFEPYKLVRYDDVTIAYIGVTTPESFTKSTPTYFQDHLGRYIYGFGEDEDGTALYACVQEAADSAKDAGADYVILVGHLGMEGSTSYWNSENVIGHTNGIHAAIDGHSHEAFTRSVSNKDGVYIPLVQTGTKLSSIGKLVITPSGEIKTGLVEEVSEKDAKVQSVMDDIKAQYEESLKAVLGHADVALTSVNPETGERAVRNAETNLGDFCADAFRYMMGADIGIMNGGGIRASLSAGDITYGDALTVFPFGNMLCVAEVTGQQIKDALEMGVRLYPEENGGFIQISGLTYTIDTSIPSSVVTDEKKNFAGVAGEYRVTDIYVGSEPLDLQKTYTVASHNYWLKSGGDGMSMFVGSNIVKDETMVDVDSITSYISEYLNGSVGEEYKNPQGQGRITIQ